MEKDLSTFRLRGSQQQLEAYTIPMIEAAVFEWVAQQFRNGFRPAYIPNRKFRETFGIGDAKRKKIVGRFIRIGCLNVQYRSTKWPYDWQTSKDLANMYTVDFGWLSKRENLRILVKENSEYFDKYLELYRQLHSDWEKVQKSIRKAVEQQINIRYDWEENV